MDAISHPVRSALVTGATRGIGRGIARSLGAQGWALTLSGRNTDLLESVAHEVRGAGAADVVVAPADLAHRGEVGTLVGAHATRFESLDALVLNAGVGTAGRLANGDLSRVDKTLEVNFRSAVSLVAEAIPLMRKAAAIAPYRGAKIIALASIAGIYPEAGLAAYGASKAALISLMETVNREESAQGITATAVAPGFVDTDMSEWVTERIPRDEMIPVQDVVTIVDMLLGLSRKSAIGRVIVERSANGSLSA